MTSTEPQITPEDVRSMGRELKVARGGVGEILQARARATCDSAADEIERLGREVAVRDRALEAAVRQFSGCSDEQVREDIAELLADARAEITAEEAATDAD